MEKKQAGPGRPIGYICSDETKQITSDTMAGRKFPQERKDHMKQYMRGNTNARKHLPDKASKGLQLYSLWMTLKYRCYNVKDPMYYNFGAKGVKVCDRWLNSFRCFLEDVEREIGPKPGKGRNVIFDRLDKNKDFEPGNVRWKGFIKLSFDEKL